jgi:hypothetical protein
MYGDYFKKSIAAATASPTLETSVPTPCAESSLPPAYEKYEWKVAMIAIRTHLATNDISHSLSPFASVNFFLHRRRNKVDMGNFTAIWVHTEYVQGFVSLSGLKSDAL